MMLEALLALAVSAAGVAAESSRPSVVQIFVVRLGFGELSCQDSPQIPSPRIDSITAQGMRFTSGYVTAPNCSPSPAGLLTGRIQTRFGYDFDTVGDLNDELGVGLPLSEITLAEHLLTAVYATNLVGKWHLVRAWEQIDSGMVQPAVLRGRGR